MSRLSVRLLLCLQLTLLVAGLLCAAGLSRGDASVLDRTATSAPPVVPTVHSQSPAVAASPAPDPVAVRPMVRPAPIRPVSVRPVSVRPASVRPASVRPASVRPASKVVRASAPARRAPAATPAQRGQAALAGLRFPWRELGWTVSFEPGRRGILGEANSRTRHVVVYVRSSQTDRQLRVTLAHELGHALDMTYGTTERRTRYRELRGLPTGDRWFPCSGCPDLSSHAGDFAEVFALWAAGPGDFRSEVAPAPDARHLAALAELFRVPRA